MKRSVVIGIVIMLIAAAGGIYLWGQEKPHPSYSMICIPKVMEEGNDFWNQVRIGASMAAQEYGVNLEFMAAETEMDYEQQNQRIEEAIEKCPDAILLSAIDCEKNMEAAKAVKEHGIKLGIIDSGIKEDIADIIISTDNEQLGIRLAALTRTLLDEGDKIGVISFVENSQTAIDREMGFRIGLSDEEGAIAEVYYCDSDYGKAYEGVYEMLERHPDIKVIAGLNQYAAVGAARALLDMGMTGKIKLVGVDSSVEQIQYLEQGVFEGIVIQNPFNIGYLGVEKAVKLLDGQNVARKTNSGSTLITKDNMYIGMNQKLLFPFQ